MTAQELIDRLLALPAETRALPVLLEIETEGMYGSNAITDTGVGDFSGIPYVGLTGTDDVLGPHGLGTRRGTP
jgi:hypothetical protein